MRRPRQGGHRSRPAAYAAPIREQLAASGDLTLLNVSAGRAESWVRDGLDLIGNAAHAHSPLGAPEINLVLQDATVLHPVLLEVLRDDRDSPDALRALHGFTELRGRLLLADRLPRLPGPVGGSGTLGGYVDIGTVNVLP